jgi:hypothetical protein
LNDKAGFAGLFVLWALVELLDRPEAKAEGKPAEKTKA